MPVPQSVPALTSVRAFAAMAIALLHFGLATGVHVLPESWVPTQGLSLFFVLSGFILAYRYPELGSRRAKVRFYGARIARVWPLHLFTLGIVLLVLPIPYQHSVGAGTFFLNAFLLHAWVPSYPVYASFNSPSFSLSIELFLYLCFPLLIRGRGWTWIVKLGGPLLLAGGMIVLADNYLASLPSGVDRAGLVYNHPFPRLWEFSLGVGAAFLWRRLAGRVRLRPAAATALEAGAVLLIVANLTMGRRMVAAMDGGDVLGRGAELWILNAGFASIPIAALLVLLGLGGGLVSRALSWRPLVVLGEVSYSIYLLHGLLILPIALRWDVFGGLGGTQLALGYCAALLAASYLSWAVVEVPARAALRDLTERFVSRFGVRPEASRPPAWRAGLTRRAVAASAGVLALTMGSVAVAAPAGSMSRKLPDVGGSALVWWDHAADGSPPVVAVGRGEAAKVSGWIVDRQGRSSVRGLLASVGSRTVWIPGGHERPDVVVELGETYRFSGFSGKVPLSGLSRGQHRLEARAVLFRPAGYVRLDAVSVRVE